MIKAGEPNFSVNHTIIKYHNYTFMITDSPNVNNLDTYLENFRKHNVSTIVRLCEPYYDASIIEKAGMTVIDLPYEDGSTPDSSIINSWCDIVSKHKDRVIAVHCFSGLGRAPLLVCVSLIENGMEKLEAIETIRKHRNGALNSRQISFIINYSSKIVRNKWFSCLFQ
jgi:protein tyrosine phosphatase type 4A